MPKAPTAPNAPPKAAPVKALDGAPKGSSTISDRASAPAPAAPPVTILFNIPGLIGLPAAVSPPAAADASIPRLIAAPALPGILCIPAERALVPSLAPIAPGTAYPNKLATPATFSAPVSP